MSFKKVLIALAATGFTGETLKHTVTKTNLKNQPELAEEGIKVGDVVDIVKPEEKPASTSKEKAPAKEKTNAPKENAPKGSVQSSEERASEIAEKFGVELVIENPETGEFFTSENLALLSVKGDKRKLKNHNF